MKKKRQGGGRGDGGWYIQVSCLLGDPQVESIKHAKGMVVWTVALLTVGRGVGQLAKKNTLHGKNCAKRMTKNKCYEMC